MTGPTARWRDWDPIRREAFLRLIRGLDVPGHLIITDYPRWRRIVDWLLRRGRP